MPCSAVSPVKEHLALQGGLLCVCNAPTLVAEPLLLSAQSSAVALHLLWAGLVPVLLMGQSGATLGLAWVRPVVHQSCSGSKLQGTSPVLSSEMLLLEGRACSQIRCLPPPPLPPTPGAKVAVVCVVIFPFPWAGVTLVGVGLGCCCLHTARLVLLPHRDSSRGWVGGGRSAEEHRYRGMLPASPTALCCGNAPIAALENFC